MASSSTSSSTTQEEETILRAIVVSSSTTWSGQPISTSDRQTAFQVLADFAKYPGRIPLCLKWLQEGPVLWVQGNDCTVSTKLYACELLTDFLKHQYAKFSEAERLELRRASLTAARMEASVARTDSSILSNKLASLLAALVVRDFPQRWTTCMEDLFFMWNAEQPQMGNKMCLEILKLVAEDCTDSDFNVKVCP